MRCACHGCGAYMVHSESMSLGCVCPQCGRRCKDCLGTGTLLSPEELKALAQDPAFAANFGAQAFYIRPAGEEREEYIGPEAGREEELYGD